MDGQRKQEERLFFTAYVLWMIYALLGISRWRTLPYVGDVREYMEAAAYLVLLAQLLTRTRYTGRDIAGLFLIAAVCALAGLTQYNDQIIPATIFLYFSRNIDYRKILKWTFVIQAVFLIVTVSASQLGLIEDVIWNEQGRIRHSLGYDYCGYPAHLLLFMTLMWFCIRKKIRIADGIFLLVLNYLMYRVTDSRTDFVLAVLGIAGYHVWTRNYRFSWIDKVRGFAERYAFVVLMVGTTAIHLFYRPEINWMQRLNTALNGRLALGNQAIRTYGFSLFGEEIRWFGQGGLKVDPNRVYNYVDCAFLKEMLTYGVLFMAVLAFGYYLLGRKTSREKDHVLGWSILMTLAYGVFNAHLCMLMFNVFILALGRLLADDEAGEYVKQTDGQKNEQKNGQKNEQKNGQKNGQKNEQKNGQKNEQKAGKTLGMQENGGLLHACKGLCRKLEEQSDKFMAAVADCRPTRAGEKTRHFLRIVVMLAVLCYVTAIQGAGANTLSKYASMHMWLVCGALLVLTLLCCEENGRKRLSGSKLLWLTIAFLLLICVSDLLVEKRFRYGGFYLLAFGGLFCRAWCNMRRPEQLIGELRSACRIWFVGVLMCCVFFVPAFFGVCYPGIFVNAGYLGVSLLPVLAVFLSGVSGGKNGIPDGVCAVLAFYLIWLSQQTLVFLAAAGLIMLFLVFRFCLWIQADGKEKARQALWALCTIAVGVAAVFLLRELLYRIAPLFGDGLAYKKEAIQEPIIESLSEGGWLSMLQDRLWNCKEYLKQINLFGHKYLAKFAGKKRWAQNSIAMNGFRYGAAVGAAYAAMLALYLWQAIRLSLREKNFFALGVAVACLAPAMTEAVEMPFIQIAWLGLYFGLAWILVSNRKEKKNAVSEYRNRQSDL